MKCSLRQANTLLVAVVVVSAAVLLWGTIQTYRHVPPLPGAFVVAGGQALFDRQQIRDGQAAFEKHDLMGFGTLLGNGAYFGPGLHSGILGRVARHHRG